jgi:hypothetical protein
VFLASTRSLASQSIANVVIGLVEMVVRQLDIQVSNGEALLKKYDLKANDAILADEKHM